MQALIRVVILIALAAIVVSLGSALYHLSRGTQQDSAKMVRALTVRIALSLALFALIMLAWYTGLIAPHGVIPPSR
ncbi:MAG: twin transmembrane helix small protein [Steroidobacteraceae bacterium]